MYEGRDESNNHKSKSRNKTFIYIGCVSPNPARRDDSCRDAFHRLRQSSQHARADSPIQIAIFIKPSFHPPYGVAPEVVVIDMPSLAEERPEQRKGRRCHGERKVAQKNEWTMTMRCGVS